VEKGVGSSKPWEDADVFWKSRKRISESMQNAQNRGSARVILKVTGVSKTKHYAQ